MPTPPAPQMEIQLGHMCNNRCVFCVSGQRTAAREALPMEPAPILEAIRAAHAQGVRRLTLLGGEPTIQPAFMDVLRAAVALGFDEIVVFTNGVKTARAAFVDEVLAVGGNVTWRLSLQGATGAAHDRTTRKLGSFQRIRESLVVLAARRQRVTVNMCVVRSNYASVEAFPELLLAHGVTQLHLDMVRPMDAGVRTEDEMRAMLPRYTDIAPHLARMVAGFPAGFDVNLGNVPYCVAPALAPWIHHDGEATLTVAVGDRDALSEPWDKYAVKRRDKVKPPSCARCVFDPQCSGVFDTYREFYGFDELVPVTAARLAQVDPAGRLFGLQVRPFLARLAGWSPPAPWSSLTVVADARPGEVLLYTDAGRGPVTLALRPPGAGVAGTDRFSLHVLDAPDVGADTLALLRAVFTRLCDREREQQAAQGDEREHAAVRHPVGDDAGAQSARPAVLGHAVDARVAACLARLRARAPFGALAWHSVDVRAAGREAVAGFTGPDGAAVSVTLAVRGANVAGSYRLEGSTTPTAALAEGVRAVMDALRGPGPAPVATPAGTLVRGRPRAPETT